MLSNNPNFAEQILKVDSQALATNADSISEEIRFLVMTLRSGKFKRITPYSLKKKMDSVFANGKYVGKRQQDAHELMVDILNKYEEETNQLLNSEQSVFVGTELRRLTCNKCMDDAVSQPNDKETKFSSLHIQLPENVNTHKLEDCLANLLGTETVTWNCDKCQSSEATMQTSICEHPQNLLVQIKRFENKGTIKNPILVKNQSHVEFQDTLVLPLKSETLTTKRDCTYKLQSVILHEGSSVESGHYYAACYNSKSETWCIYNDDRPARIACHSDIHNSNAYVLLYEKEKVSVELSKPNKQTDNAKESQSNQCENNVAGNGFTQTEPLHMLDNADPIIKEMEDLDGKLEDESGGFDKSADQTVIEMIDLEKPSNAKIFEERAVKFKNNTNELTSCCR